MKTRVLTDPLAGPSATELGSMVDQLGITSMNGRLADVTPQTQLLADAFDEGGWDLIKEIEG